MNEWMNEPFAVTIVDDCTYLCIINEIKSHCEWETSAGLNRTKATQQNKANGRRKKKKKTTTTTKWNEYMDIIRSDCMLKIQEDGKWSQVIVWRCVCLDSAFGTLPCDAMTIVISVILASRLLSANLFTESSKTGPLSVVLAVGVPFFFLNSLFLFVCVV